MHKLFRRENQNDEVFIGGELLSYSFRDLAGHTSRRQNSHLELRTGQLHAVLNGIVGISRRSESLSEIEHAGSTSSLKNTPSGGTSFFLTSKSPLGILSDHTGLLLASAGYFYKDLDRDWARIAKQKQGQKI